MGVRIREKVRGSGVFWVFINHKNCRTSKKVGTRRNASKVAEQIEAQLKLDLPTFASNHQATPTLKEYFQQFQRTYLQTAVKESTRDSYETNFRLHILPVLGRTSLAEIKRPHVKDLIGSLIGKNLAKASVGIVVRELCTVLNHAVEDELIVRNPATRMGKFYRHVPSRHGEIRPLTFEEVRSFLAVARLYHQRYYPILLCAVHTGLRLGELLGLQWQDIDFQEHNLTVRRSISRGRIVTTKSDKVRRVDLSDTLTRTLHGLRLQYQEDRLRKGQNRTPEWVFYSSKGTKLDPFNLKSRHFLPCLKTAGLRRIRFHDLRHTFASLLLYKGAPLKYISEQLGHSSIQITADIYAHLIPGANREFMNTLPCPDDGLEQDLPEVMEA